MDVGFLQQPGVKPPRRLNVLREDTLKLVAEKTSMDEDFSRWGVHAHFGLFSSEVLCEAPVSFGDQES